MANLWPTLDAAAQFRLALDLATVEPSLAGLTVSVTGLVRTVAWIPSDSAHRY